MGIEQRRSSATQDGPSKGDFDWRYRTRSQARLSDRDELLGEGDTPAPELLESSTMPGIDPSVHRKMDGLPAGQFEFDGSNISIAASDIALRRTEPAQREVLPESGCQIQPLPARIAVARNLELDSGRKRESRVRRFSNSRCACLTAAS